MRPFMVGGVVMFHQSSEAKMIDRDSQETTVLQTYANSSDAEIARSFLRDNGIESFVSADDVHVSIQFSGGARLIVMESDSERAYELLRTAGLDSEGFLPDEEDGI
jgi:hypothetical protein